MSETPEGTLGAVGTPGPARILPVDPPETTPPALDDDERPAEVVDDVDDTAE